MHKLDVAAKVKAGWQKSIWRAKDNMWNEYLENLRSAQVWKVPMFANSLTAGAVVALTNRDGKHANTITNQKSMLKRESSPPNEQNQSLELPLAAEAHLPIIEQAGT
jgi:hypothetical protein